MNGTSLRARRRASALLLSLCILGVVGPAHAVKDGMDATGDPRVVALIRSDVNNLQAGCTGALVAPRVVFTAAHCTIMKATGVPNATVENAQLPISGELPKPSQFFIGAPGLIAPKAGPVKMVAVVAQFSDARYRNSIFESGNPRNHGPMYDFAVLVLAEPLSSTSYRYATRAELDELVRAEAEVFAIGYGMKSAADQALANSGAARDPRPTSTGARLRSALHQQNNPTSDYSPEFVLQTQLPPKVAMGGGDSGSPLWASINGESVYLGALSGAIGPSAIQEETHPMWSDPYWGTRAGGSYFAATAFESTIERARAFLRDLEAKEAELHIQAEFEPRIRALSSTVGELGAAIRNMQSRIDRLLRQLSAS